MLFVLLRTLLNDLNEINELSRERYIRRNCSPYKFLYEIFY